MLGCWTAITALVSFLVSYACKYDFDFDHSMMTGEQLSKDTEFIFHASAWRLLWFICVLTGLQVSSVKVRTRFDEFEGLANQVRRVGA